MGARHHRGRAEPAAPAATAVAQSGAAWRSRPRARRRSRSEAHRVMVRLCRAGARLVGAHPLRLIAVQSRAAPRRDRRSGPLFDALLANVERVIQGKREPVRLALVCLFAEGHLLIEDVPGVGKTSLAKALARSIDGTWQPHPVHARPAAVRRHRRVGVEPGRQRVRVPARRRVRRTSCSPTRSTARRRRRSRRCSRRWRSARSRSTRSTYRLPRPFMVIATQNPIELEGTYPLPEAQLDRFLMRIQMGYPTR